MASKRNHYTKEEIKFIELNWRFKTDKEIGRILGRSENSVILQRKKFGWVKANGRPPDDFVLQGKVDTVVENGFTPISMATLDKDQRLELYKQNFNKNPRFGALLVELHKAEMEYYIHKYVEFMSSIETVTIQEEDALHHMIMADISISRIRRRIKQMEDTNHEDDTPLMPGMYDALDKAEKKFMEYQKILRVTREGRLKEDKETKETFLSLVQMYKQTSAREEMGRQASLMKIYQDKCKEDMKASRYLLGDI